MEHRYEYTVDFYASVYFYKYRITLSTENITSTLLRVFYIFVYYTILWILVSLNFPLIRKNP